jgi:hypothetical protein
MCMIMPAGVWIDLLLLTVNIQSNVNLYVTVA